MTLSFNIILHQHNLNPTLTYCFLFNCPSCPVWFMGNVNKMPGNRGQILPATLTWFLKLIAPPALIKTPLAAGHRISNFHLHFAQALKLSRCRLYLIFFFKLPIPVVIKKKKLHDKIIVQQNGSLQNSGEFFFVSRRGSLPFVLSNMIH